MTEIILVIALVLVAAGVAVVALRTQKPKEDSQNPALLLLQQQLSELTKTIDAKLGDSTKAFQEQFGNSARLIKEITQELVRVGEGQKQVVGVTEQLKSLQDILKNPKQRGILGEYYLETVLKNVLPPGVYVLQYPFKDGVIVDAIVKTRDGIIPIDSKFSLENYNRILEASEASDRERYETAFVNDLKIRVDETSKYVKPEEGTLDFAFMFIPSEAVYYDLIVNRVGAVKANTTNLIEYAWKKKVIVVSPTTFLAYLQTVLQGLKALKIEEAAQKIAARVQDLGKHLNAYQSYFDKVGGHLGTAVSMYNKAGGEFKKIDKDVLKITGESIGAEPTLIEGQVEEQEN